MSNTENLSQEKLIVLKQAASNHLIDFSIALNEKYDANWHHEIIATALEQAIVNVENNKKARIILELPPRHGKSEEATVNFPAYVLGKHPDWPIITASYSADLAEDFGLKAKDLMRDPIYKLLFSNVNLRADTTAKGKWLTNKGGGYTATGVGGSITGKGFKIGIIDDPFKNREEADSETIRDKVWKWYTSTFYTRQEGVGAIIVICTRWHLDDLVGRLLAEEARASEQHLAQYDNWQVIRFPAIADEDEQYRPKGAPLWPAKFPLPVLENIKNTIGVYDWAALYQQEPILAENAEFRQEYFKYYDANELPQLDLIYKTTIDPAISQEKEADNTVIRTVAKQRTGANWYLIDEIAGHLDPLQTIDAIFQQFGKYRSEIWIETVAYQKALKYFLEEEQRRRQVYFDVNELKMSGTNKEARIRGLIPLYKAGVIYHRHSDVDLERELLQFPKGKHDDRADALAMHLEAQEHTAYGEGGEEFNMYKKSYR